MQQPLQSNGGIFLEAKTTPKTLLHKLNTNFLKQHTEASNSALSAISSVIVYKSGKLSLWINKQNQFTQIETHTAIQAPYTCKKTIR